MPEVMTAERAIRPLLRTTVLRVSDPTMSGIVAPKTPIRKNSFPPGTRVANREFGYRLTAFDMRNGDSLSFFFLDAT
jgi:hypothetical protein